MPLVPPRAALLIVLAVSAAPAQAQAQAPASPPRQATTWEAVEQSMSALLNGGHRIVAAAGPTFTLEKEGRYVVCEVRPAGGMGNRAQTTSLCHRLN